MQIAIDKYVLMLNLKINSPQITNRQPDIKISELYIYKILLTSFI